MPSSPLLRYAGHVETLAEALKGSSLDLAVRPEEAVVGQTSGSSARSKGKNQNENHRGNVLILERGRPGSDL